MKRLAAVTLVLIAAALAASPGLAQGGASGGGVRAACADDLAKLCPDAQPGPDRRQCMMSHQDQLSDGCKAAIAAAMARRQAGQSAPAPHN
jgi:hypothetical protein